MLITKEQQEAWMTNYIKEGHSQDECIGFIDGMNKAISFIAEKMPNNGISPFVGRCLAFGIQIFPYELNKIISASEKYKIPDEHIYKLNKSSFDKYIRALVLSQREDSRDWGQSFEMLKELGFEEQSVVSGHRKFINMVFKTA